MKTLRHYTKPELAIIEVASTAIMAGSITPGDDSANANLLNIEEKEDVEFD